MPDADFNNNALFIEAPIFMRWPARSQWTISVFCVILALYDVLAGEI
jgi:hypothetical protein